MCKGTLELSGTISNSIRQPRSIQWHHEEPGPSTGSCRTGSDEMFFKHLCIYIYIFTYVTIYIYIYIYRHYPDIYMHVQYMPLVCLIPFIDQATPLQVLQRKSTWLHHWWMQLGGPLYPRMRKVMRRTGEWKGISMMYHLSTSYSWTDIPRSRNQTVTAVATAKSDQLTQSMTPWHRHQFLDAAGSSNQIHMLM